MGKQIKRWQVLAPFAHTPTPGWIVAEAALNGHEFAVVPAGYDHDRSRPATGGRAWLDYLWHGWRTFAAAGRGDGFITWFPQLAVCVGLINRITRARRPHIAWCFNIGGMQGGWRARLVRFALRDVDVFVVHARREIAAYAEWLQLPAERFAFVPLSVATPEQRQLASEPFVLAMGSARRDYALFIEVMRDLDLPAVIVCAPHALARLDIPVNVTLLSKLMIEACHDLAAHARVNVMPIANDSTASGQVTVIEAMMLGKAVVATHCIGTEDYVIDGATGLLVPPADPQALRVAITSLWRDGALRRALGDEARKTALRQCSFTAGGLALGAHIEKIASRRTPQPVGVVS